MRRHIELVSIRHIPTPPLENCPSDFLLRARVLLELEGICYDNVDNVVWFPSGVIEGTPSRVLRTMLSNESAVMDDVFASRIHARALQIVAAGRPEPLGESTMILARIIAEIAGLEYSGLITVFGSMAALAANPGDLDLCVDLSEIQFEDSNQLAEFAPLLAIARKHYGLVDPFLKFRNALLVRNDDATGWVRARNSKAIGAQIYKTGRPLADVLTLYPC